MMETKTLTIEQYFTSTLIDNLVAELGINSPDVRSLLDYHASTQAHMLSSVMRVPADVLQNDRVIATYPTTLWDYIKRSLRLKYKRTEVRISEHLLYPMVEAPPFANNIRLFTDSRLSFDEVQP